MPARELQNAQGILWDQMVDLVADEEKAQERLEDIWMQFTGGSKVDKQTHVAFKKANVTHRKIDQIVKSDLWDAAMDETLIRIQQHMPELEAENAGLMRMLGIE